MIIGISVAGILSFTLFLVLILIVSACLINLNDDGKPSVTVLLIISTVIIIMLMVIVSTLSDEGPINKKRLNQPIQLELK